MSLAQHVTQADGFEYEFPPAANQPSSNADRETSSVARVVTPSKPEWQRMNFSPTGSDSEEAHIAAYKVSVAKRIVQVATAIAACWLSAGIVFGFAALKPVLVAEGVYGDLCDGNDTALWHSPNAAAAVPCDEQDLRLNLFFTVASVAANVSSLLAGYALDKYGRRTCWIVACVLLLSGSLLMAASFAIPKLDAYLVANVLLSLGGTFIFVPSFELANALPKYSGIVVAMTTGAFDASAAVFLLFGAVYEATGGRISVASFFFGYAMVPVLILAAELAYMPQQSYHTISELEHKIEKAQDSSRDVHESDDDVQDAQELARVQDARAARRMAKLDRIESITGDSEHRDQRRRINKARQTASGRVWGVMHGVPTRRQLLSPWFMLILLLTSIQMLRMNYFIATIRSQYRYMLGSDERSASVNRFFDMALPVGGAVTTPFIGVLLNNHGISTILCFLTALIILIGTLNCLPYLWAGYATVVAFIVFRPLYYSAVSDYATKIFGFTTFGRIYGTLICVSGVVNLAQSGLDALVHGALDGNPTPVNVAFTVAGACTGAALTIFATAQARSLSGRDGTTPPPRRGERRPLLLRD
ncbi:MFS transporter [Metarhizium album ARSEF 1941]|uniref:MFS transporter n=1 Tax=Metarhizium album (strain ARSEF 1941) TaxID=1081103 RepID=A0A0B2WYX5_METAS|nr:MFS transporter [Metarhizium album ARSEF 1941]KHO01497.1 MFS transporter [Metarhizium album ARSEF 1941]